MICVAAVAALAAALTACSPTQAPAGSSAAQGTAADAVEGGDAPAVWEAVALGPGEKLHVAATTGIVADVVANVGGESIELVTLMPAGADPHSFTPTPQDLRSLNDADVIFVNGLGLEESLLPILENLDRPTPIVSVNSGVETSGLGDSHGQGGDHADEETHGAGEADPHTWFSVPNVMIWTDTILKTLSELDPAQAEAYAALAAAYRETLTELDAEIRTQVETLPAERRKLATDHVELGYFASEYGFEVVGSVLPSLSTLASASAQELAALQEKMAANNVPALFVGTTVNAQTARQLANDLGIPVVELYTGSLSEAGGPASTYVDLMRYDVARIVEALQ